MSILLETSLGDLVFDLHVDLCPKASLNFVKLCKNKYYNNCIFHSGILPPSRMSRSTFHFRLSLPLPSRYLAPVQIGTSPATNWQLWLWVHGMI